MIDEYCVEDLRDIAENYDCYDDISDEKLDFDRALDFIGKGYWDGEVLSIGEYKEFSKLQRLVIADILGVELKVRYSPQLLGRAYGKMCKFLNRS